MPKFNQYREQHRDRLAALIQATRTRDTIYLVSGYCNNSACDIRDVLVRIKDYNETPPSLSEFRCPGCRGLLEFGSNMLLGGEPILTAREYVARKGAQR